MSFYKKHGIKKDNVIWLRSQSTQNLYLKKDSVQGIYFIKNLKHNTHALIGDREQSEDLILYGLKDNLDIVKTLTFE